MKVLVVDDDTTNRKLLRLRLEQEHGVSVLEAADGMEGLLVLERERVNAIISDVLMPRLDGYRFCSAVRKDPRFSSLPFIIYTSTFISPGDERLAREVGADEYLKKPVSTNALVEALDRAAAERKRRHAEVSQMRDELPLVKEYNELLVKSSRKSIATFCSRLKNCARASNAVVCWR